MHVLLCSSYPHLPETRGGLQTSTDELALALQERGCGVTVLCGRMDGLESDPPLRPDHSLGYPVVRAADPVAALARVAADAGASVLLVQSGYSLASMLASALDTGRPTAVYLHNVEIHRIGGILPPDPGILYFANSHFTAGRWKALFGIHCHILPPVIRADRYRLPSTGTGDRVLFVNPVPEKGIERVMEVAAGNPDLPFLIAESWHVGDDWRAWLQRRFGALPNVEWRPAAVDVRELFRDARLLLMPSVWEEAYGRTVVEAQLNGLPVLASDRGALPATVGGGGAVLDLHGSGTRWNQMVRRFYFDIAVWEEAAEAALANAQRMLDDGTRSLDDALARLDRHGR